ncbi:MAG: hypothetical protein RLZZ292_3839 [Bacteroidota bacterium]|jgi:hypothetical protein
MEELKTTPNRPPRQRFLGPFFEKSEDNGGMKKCTDFETKRLVMMKQIKQDR